MVILVLLKVDDILLTMRYHCSEIAYSMSRVTIWKIIQVLLSKSQYRNIIRTYFKKKIKIRRLQ